MYKTKIDLSEKIRRNVILILNDRLADAIDLQSQVKQAHWNVKGPNFIALHELFDKINEDVEDYVDDIAERRGLDDQDSFHLGGSGRQARKAVRMPRISR